MKVRTILWIILGAVALHLAGFMVFARMNPLPKVRFEPPPNFGVKEITWVNQETGEKSVERQIRVSTKLAPAGTYEARPPKVAEASR